MELSNENSAAHGTLQAATHLAARAVVALRAGFRIERIALNEADGITCDWRQARTPSGDDIRVLQRGFAFVYAGTVVDRTMTETISEELRKELDADMSHAQDAREAAVDWGLAPTLKDTNPFAHVGYKLASRIIRGDRPLIDRLAAELLNRKVLDEEELLIWFRDNAPPCSLEELEQSITY